MAGVSSGAIATGQITMTGAAVLVVTGRSDRKRLVLIMGGTVADTFIGPGSTVTVGNGALLSGVKGQSIVLETQAAVYAIGTAAAVISYIEEFA